MYNNSLTISKHNANNKEFNSITNIDFIQKRIATPVLTDRWQNKIFIISKTGHDLKASIYNHSL